MVISSGIHSLRQGREKRNGIRSLNTRLRIIHTAHRLFRDQGFDKTRITEVAQVLRMSSANVYRFFISKHDLRRAVTSRLLDANYGRLKKITRHRLSATIRLKMIITVQFAMTCDLHRNFPRLFELITISASEREDLICHHQERIMALVSELIAQGVHSGEFPPQDIRRNVQVCILSLARVWHPVLIATEGAKPETKPAELFDFCFSALRNGFQIPSQKE